MSIATTPPSDLTEEAAPLPDTPLPDAPLPDAPRPTLRAVRPIEPARTVRLRIERIGVASAARTAAILSVIVGASLVASGAVLWWAAGSAGLLGWFEEAVANGLGLDSWSLPGGTLLLVWTAVAAVLTALTVLVVTLLVVAFNQTGGSLGGIDLSATAQDVDTQA